MRENLPKTRYINSYADVVKMFSSDTNRVVDASLVGDDLMFIQYQLIDEEVESNRKSNVVLAAFTTAHARCFLYKNMVKVKDPRNILYCDTDSIMYLQDGCSNTEPDIELGSFMGDMTDEIPSNVVFTDFFSGGPKFYCLSGFYSDTSNDYNVFKMKGITRNRACEKIFGKDGFKKLVLQEVHELRSPFSSMKRCVRSGRIHNSFCQKVTKTTSNKRVFRFFL